MKFLDNIINRIITHWQSSLFGVSYAVIFWLLYDGKIDVSGALGLLTGILAFKGIFVNKDADKVETKPEVKEKEIKP